MKHFNLNDQLECPHCNHKQSAGNAEDYVICEGNHAESIEVIECEDCYESFPAQYDSKTNKVIVTT